MNNLSLQLGGKNSLKCNIGAYNFIEKDNFLEFKFKNEKANWVKIFLNGKNLYSMVFFKDDIFCKETKYISINKLADEFEENTGLILRSM